MNHNLPGVSVHGILQTRVLEWAAIFFSRGSSWPRYWTLLSCILGRFFTIWATSFISSWSIMFIAYFSSPVNFFNLIIFIFLVVVFYFPLRKLSLTFLIKPILWCWTFNFCLSVELFISSSNLNLRHWQGRVRTVRIGHETTDLFQIGKRVHQGYILSLCLFKLYAEYIMRNTG